MNNTHFTRLPGILLLCLFTLGGCGTPDKQRGDKKEDGKERDSAKSSQATDAPFQTLSDEFLNGYLKRNPRTATSLGLHEYDGKVHDVSRKGIDEETAFIKSMQTRLAAIDIKALSPAAAYDYRIMETALQYERFSLEELQSWRTNPMTYAGMMDINIYIKRDFAPLEERIKSIIAILNTAPMVFANARANLDDSLAKPYIETAVLVATGSAAFLAKDLLVALKGVKNDSLMKAFKAANDKAIQEIRSFSDYLKKEKLPKAHNRYAIGKAKYQQMLATEMITMTPEEILALGLKMLKREQEIFAETAKKIDASKKPIEVYKTLQQEHPTAANLIPDTRKNLEAIREFVVRKNIITVPSEVRVKVEETPEYDRATSFASMDTPGAFETKATEAYYYVTPADAKKSKKEQDEWLTAFNYYTTDVVSIHEAYPGHYVQFLRLNASPASRLAKVFGSYAFIEGWAHYTEQMLLDEGFAADKDSVTAAKYRLAQSDEALLRLCRLCVSIKTHCEGMTLDDATKFFEENCYYEGEPARQEAVRGTFDPGYLYYTLGKLQLLKLRDDYKQQEGANYSLQKFHDEITNRGMPPVPLLRESMLKDKSAAKQIL